MAEPLRTGLAALLWWAFAASAPAWGSADEPASWLERMTDSLRTLSYEGTFVYLSAGQLESLRIERTIDEAGRETERLVSLNGAPREVVRNGASVTRVLPHSGSAFIRHSAAQADAFPAALGAAYDRLAAHYQFAMGSADRVAGRAAVQVIVKPRDRLRYGYLLWLDQATALPLRADMLNEEDEPVEQVMFTDLRPGKGASPPQAVQKKQGVADQKATDSAKSPGKSRWRLGDLPAGYALRSIMAEAMPGRPLPVDHFVITDGLVSVSIYMEPVAESKRFEGDWRMGAISAYGRQLNDYQITVVGAVPPETARLIGEAISRSDSDP